MCCSSRCCCCCRRGPDDVSSSTSSSSSCPQWPDRCCLCLPKRLGVVLTGVLSILASLAVILPAVYALVRPEFWNEAYKRVDDWVVHNHWDSVVTSRSLELLGWVSAHHAVLLIALIAYAALHVFNSLLLVIGALLERRLMFIPWLIHDLLSICLVGLAFVFWAFFSFFVHVLVAVFFPVAAGLALGVWVYLWRNAKDLFHLLGASNSDGLGQATVYRKLPAGGGGGTRSLIMT